MEGIIGISTFGLPVPEISLPFHDKQKKKRVDALPLPRMGNVGLVLVCNVQRTIIALD